MIRIIEEKGLVAHTQRVGGYVYESLEALQKEKAAEGKLINLRGKGEGTYIAFDLPTSAQRDAYAPSSLVSCLLDYR